mmetsp:Transcript_46969/g.130490  ORF Transcript_46969/g.130490 Transcript_46969/m.130490 type:complete len:219 (-) Transcript_46969:309-965(-)
MPTKGITLAPPLNLSPHAATATLRQRAARARVSSSRWILAIVSGANPRGGRRASRRTKPRPTTDRRRPRLRESRGARGTWRPARRSTAPRRAARTSPTAAPRAQTPGQTLWATSRVYRRCGPASTTNPTAAPTACPRRACQARSTTSPTWRRRPARSPPCRRCAARQSSRAPSHRPTTPRGPSRRCGSGCRRSPPRVSSSTCRPTRAPRRSPCRSPRT